LGEKVRVRGNQSKFKVQSSFLFPPSFVEQGKGKDEDILENI
jgi:hypothetical protein